MLFQSAARESAIQATLVLREESAEVAPKDQSLAGGSNKHYDILADDQYAEANRRLDKLEAGIFKLEGVKLGSEADIVTPMGDKTGLMESNRVLKGDIVNLTDSKTALMEANRVLQGDIVTLMRDKTVLMESNRVLKGDIVNLTTSKTILMEANRVSQGDIVKMEDDKKVLMEANRLLERDVKVIKSRLVDLEERLDATHTCINVAAFISKRPRHDL